MIRILFANQDEKLSNIYINHLKHHFQVDAVQDGLMALRQIRLNRPSMVVSEYYLPSLSGIALLRFMRGHNDFKETPFLFLSNHPDNRDALSGGANDWLGFNDCHPNMLLDRIYLHLKTNKNGLQIYRA